MNLFTKSTTPAPEEIPLQKAKGAISYFNSQKDFVQKESYLGNIGAKSLHWYHLKGKEVKEFRNQLNAINDEVIKFKKDHGSMSSTENVDVSDMMQKLSSLFTQLKEVTANEKLLDANPRLKKQVTELATMVDKEIKTLAEVASNKTDASYDKELSEKAAYRLDM